MSFTLTLISKDGGVTGAEERGKKRREAPRYKRQGECREADG